MAKKLLKQYEILLFKSEEDFIASKYLLDGFNNHNLELNLDIIFFHMQQALEKLMKCLLDFNGNLWINIFLLREDAPYCQ
jgi:HEPN domain-containing protein